MLKRYVDLTERDVEIVESYFNPLYLKRREFLISEGQVGTSNFFVEKRCIRMYYVKEKLVEQTTRFAL